MNKFKNYLSAFIISVFSISFIVTNPAGAINVFDNSACNNASSAAVCKAKGDDASKMIQTIIDTMMFILGAVAVIMIVVGGIRYTTSNGDASKVKQAKDTILYSVIGLVVAILAYQIVKFVVSQFK